MTKKAEPAPAEPKDVGMQTAFLRARLQGMTLSELQNVYDYLNVDFKARMPGEWKDVKHLKAFERLVAEVNYAIKGKIETFLVYAMNANNEGPFHEE